MQSFTLTVVFLTILGTSLAMEDVCHKSAIKACNSKPPETFNCNARYGHINTIENDLQRYVNHHILASFKYLLMSTHFGNFKDQRLGFEKFFRGLSDETWGDAIDLIKYLTKRGSKMDFTQQPEELKDGSELNEFQSLSLALDIQKSLAKEANEIHGKINKNNEGIHDPEVAEYLEKHQIHELSEDIRKISGHVNDVHKLLNVPDPSLNIYLFDEYLQKL